MSAHLRVAAWCVLLVALWVRTVHADPILTYFNQAAFFSSVPIASTETFDEFQPDSDIGVGIVTLDEVTYASSDLSAIWFISDLFVAPSPPNSLVQRNVIAPATLTFGEGRFSDAIGFFLVGVGGIPVPAFRINAVAVDGERLTETIFLGPITMSIFRGFSYQLGISSITISPVEVEGSISNFHLDNVSRGVVGATAVPEPSMLALIGTAMLIGFASARRRRGGQDSSSTAHMGRTCDT